MKIGLTTYSLDNKDFREQLSSMLKSGITPDFILLHYGGLYRYLKGFRFLKRIIKQHRVKSLSFLLSHRKTKSVVVKFKLSDQDEKEVERFISSVKIIHVKGINDKSTIHTIESMGDVLIACNSGKLNTEVLNNHKAIFLNVHASKLPMYRGMNNVEWALCENNELYGTIHKIARGMDEGDILYQEKIETNNKELKTIQDYRAYCFFKSNEMVGKAIRPYLDKEIFFTKQENVKTPLAQYYVMHPLLKEHLQSKLFVG